jgi:hypothetical protein
MSGLKGKVLVVSFLAEATITTTSVTKKVSVSEDSLCDSFHEEERMNNEEQMMKKNDQRNL